MKHFPSRLAITLLAGAPMLAAHAGDTQPSGISHEIRQELAEARKEVRMDLAKAKRELETENLRVDDSPDAMYGIDGVIGGLHLFTTPQLWIGVLAGAVMIYGAIRLRRWRDEA